MSLSVEHSKILEPIFRHHAVELGCAQKLEQSFDMSGPERVALSINIVAMCQSSISEYWSEEERVLAPFLKSTAALEGLKQRHQKFDRLLDWFERIELSNDPGPERLSELGKALEDYVRWEEDVVFPELDKRLSVANWAQLAERVKMMAVRPQT